MAEALFYPWIDIRDEAWLKTALLYWDRVRTIVPVPIEHPYSTETGRALRNEGFLLPERVESGMREIEELAADALAYLNTAEGAELVVSEGAGRGVDIYLGKLPSALRRLVEVRAGEPPFEIRRLLRDFGAPGGGGRDWLRVDDGFARFYMTLLASRLAERIGAELVTPHAAAGRLAIAARFDCRWGGLVPDEAYPGRRHARDHEALGRVMMPRRLAPGMLASLAIERINIDPETPLERLLEFREAHGDELARFRAAVRRLAGAAGGGLHQDALRQHVADLYRDDVSPAVGDLKAALRGCRIEWFCRGLLGVAFMSVSGTVLSGLGNPMALLAGAGISLVATGAMYNVEKEGMLRANPYAYLLSIERELA